MNGVMSCPSRSFGRHDRWLTLAATVLIVAGTGLCPAGVATAASDDAAQRLFGEGVDAARENRWVEAREAFERAYGLSQRPVVLINLAAAEVRTGRLKEAARDYRRILEDDPSPETAAFRKAAADFLPTLEPRIPRIRLHTSGLAAADVVEIDGEQIPAAHLGEPHLVDPGTHVVVVKRSAVERARVSFSVAEGESHDISVPAPLAPLPVAPAEVPVPGTNLEADLVRGPHPAERRSVWRSPWLWAAIAAVVAGTTVATVFAARSHDQAFSGNLPPGTVSVQ